MYVGFKHHCPFHLQGFKLRLWSTFKIILSLILHNSLRRLCRRLSINAFISKKPWILKISNKNAATIWRWLSNLSFKYSQLLSFPGESFSSMQQQQQEALQFFRITHWVRANAYETTKRTAAVMLLETGNISTW